MGLTEIKQGILDVLLDADPQAVVQDFEAWSIEDDPQTVIDLFKTQLDPHIRAWVFKPVAIREETSTRQCNSVSYQFSLRMLDEIGERRDTGDTWEIIETVRAAFRNNPTLSGACWSTKVGVGGGEVTSGLQVDAVDFIRVENRSVQYGEFSLTAWDLIAG